MTATASTRDEQRPTPTGPDLSSSYLPTRAVVAIVIAAISAGVFFVERTNAVTSRIAAVGEQVADLGTDLRQDISEIREGMATRSEVAALQSRVSAMEAEISALRAKVEIAIDGPR